MCTKFTVFVPPVIMIAVFSALLSRAPERSAAQAGAAPATVPSDLPPRVIGAEIDEHLTKQMSDILLDCQTIKPGMTRAELLRVFTTEGGLSTAKNRTFVYRRCPFIKIDVVFDLSSRGQNVLDEESTDTVNKISKPYLDWSVLD